MSSPLVSILIPVFNRQDHIAECIQSALDQTYRPIEIIVVDNASTDQTWEIIQNLASEHAQLSVFRNPENVGPVRNWKRCIEMADGPLAKFLFSDDLLYPNYLTATVPLLTDNVGFVFTGGIIGQTPGHGSLSYVWPNVPTITSGRRFVLEYGYGPMSTPLPVSPVAGLFRTADLHANLRTEFIHSDLTGLEAHGAGPDLLFYLLAASHYPKVAHLDKPLTFFRTHPGAITMQQGVNRLSVYYQAATIDVLREHWPMRYLKRFLSAIWLKEMNQLGRYISFKEFVARYKLRFPVNFSLDGIVLFAVRSVKRRLVGCSIARQMACVD